jgi:hypothetical protein
MGGVMLSVLPIYAFTECKGKIYLYFVSELEAILICHSQKKWKELFPLCCKASVACEKQIELPTTE